VHFPTLDLLGQNKSGPDCCITASNALLRERCHVRRGSKVSYFVREPDCRSAYHSSVLNSLFQFLAFDKGLRGLDGGELVGHRYVVRIVGRLVHGLSSYPLRLLDRSKIVVDFAPSFVVRDRVSEKHSRHLKFLLVLPRLHQPGSPGAGNNSDLLRHRKARKLRSEGHYG
jgi:hypothetical protein